ncbi:inositol monophosphatase family protein [Wolbachia endosymbiont of Howardula sp.]|uniref:inositol monophosphatase family protein n=1 Tax=Wolbachia endosymbiont of Howardula sp. TaxID=2916816 RepID=UPI00217D50A8|nr:inositol monophosphatase family protein [Wolbachia endosymbiont of Howardula sp.]UWI83278.1 inositol monophosphatase family protein [Wolbachia endosymbiont of Howardula sp.]
MIVITQECGNIMSSISSPRINVMLESIKSASKQLMRDFNELQIYNIRSEDFINKTYSRSQNMIQEYLFNYKKDYGFIYENEQEETVSRDYNWFILPIESKENFSSCIVYFAISVCLIYKNKVIAVVIDAPALRETFWAEEKKGAFLEDARSRNVKLRTKNRSGGLIDISSNLLHRVSSHNMNIRSIGSSVLGFVYLATDRYTGLIYSGINKYKTLLGRLFLEESGGSIIEHQDLIIAGNVQLENHDSLIGIDNDLKTLTKDSAK